LEHRGDIQGLRAVAVLLVVLHHADVPVLRGGYVGVDVFFVLSGFLITGILLSAARQQGRISLVDFYVRRARRILPAAGLTLLATSIAAYYLLNVVRARAAVSDSIWATLFAANVHFGRQESDYFAQDQPPSPVQHFWTLAVEEQFYLAWPAVVSLVLFGVAFGLRRRRRRRVIGRSAMRRLLVVTVLVAITSLAWSIHSTAVEPAGAYFSTFTRAWELALGATFAIVAAGVTRLPTWVRVGMGWLGLASVVCAAVAYSPATPFPGYAALLPTVGTALVIAAGIPAQPPRLGVGRALSIVPLRYVGDRSYTFYLWHWPVLIIAVQYVGHDLSVSAKLVLALGAFLLSMLTYALLENPVRHMRRPAALGLVLSPACAAAALAVAVFTLGSLDGKIARMDAAAANVRPAALITEKVARTRSKPLPAVVAAVEAARHRAPLPSPLTPPIGDLRGDFHTFPDGCVANGADVSSWRICRLGDTASAKTLVVFGDSHAQMWMPTVLRTAEWDRWLVVPLVKAGCVPGRWNGGGSGCRAWYRWAIRRAVGLRPDVTLIVGSWAGTKTPDPDVRAVALLSSEMKRVSASVIVLGDAPHQRLNPVDCLLARDATMRTCTTRATDVQLRADHAIEAGARADRVGFIDTRGWFCARTRISPIEFLCPLVVNQTIVWIDRGHISKTYALQLAQPFRTAFRRELFR
jgi:peptidoglycan/LPS O-acetylase OafA/YrhL